MKTWCFPKEASGDYVYHMEDVLNLYAQPYDALAPVVCMDEASRQLIGDSTKHTETSTCLWRGVLRVRLLK